MPELSTATKKLISQYQEWYQALQPKEGVLTISVDEVISKIATFYEKIREIVDWQEQHLMRRIAIERKIKRRLFLKEGGENLAEPLILELIRGGLFANNRIERSKIDKAQKLLNKYTYILNNAPASDRKIRGQLYVELTEIASCEIEETLDPAFYLRENALIEFMNDLMRQKIIVGKRAQKITGITEEEKNIQIYVATQQALFKLDRQTISYNLLKYFYPDWLNLAPENYAIVAQHICEIFNKIDDILSHPLAPKFYKICERYDTPYLLLGDVLSEDPMGAEEKISEPENLEKLIRKAYNKRLNTLSKRINRSALYSTISIFLSNVFSLYLLEFPFALYVMGHINTLAAILDVVGPTFLMFLVAITVKKPSMKNLKLVVEEVKKIVYQGETKDIYEAELYPKRGIIFRILSYFLYTLATLICLGILGYIFYLLKYPPLSCLLLFIFTSLIIFTGLKIRERARELDITEKKDTVWGFLFDPLALPMVRIGKWLSDHWRKINIVSVFFVFLLDAPIFLFIEFLEYWRHFLKEKKEDIY
ncbi:MAG: hypothetical protein ACP5IX_01440 [Patescibacteria group bacterium]